MPAGRTKFQDKWLDEEDLNNVLVKTWCTKGRNINEAYCLLCLCHFSIANGGKHSILQHSSMRKHVGAWKALQGGQKTLMKTDLKIVYGGSNSADCGRNAHTVALNLSIDQQVLKAEALWAMKVANSNYSFASCSDVCPIFAMMFDAHPVAQQIRMGEKKVAYVITYALYPYFRDILLNDLKQSIKDSTFTLAFDETTTSQVKKQMDIYVRFWSTTTKTVLCAYLNSVFLGHASAEVVKEKLVETVVESGLPLNKLLMLSMDGPNVNKSVKKKLNSDLEEMGSPKLISIGTCSLHSVHNAFSKGPCVLELDIDEFATDLFGFFKLSSARREDLVNIQQLMDCEEHFLLRHVNSRWLTLAPVTERILEQYKVLSEYFLKALPKSNEISTLRNNQRYIRIRKTLNDETTLVYLEFIKHLSQALFQTEGPLVHLLYEKMNDLLRKIMLKFVKQEKVANLSGKKLLDVDLENHENLLSLKNVDFGVGTKRVLNKLNDGQSKNVKYNLQQCLIKVCSYLKKILPLTNPILRDVQVLHPLMREDPKTDQAITRLSMNLKPLGLSDADIDVISHEWKVYRQDINIQRDWYAKDIVCEVGTTKTIYKKIDEYWSRVFQIVDIHTGTLKYSHLAKIVKCALTMSHGNSDPERGFSVNSALISKNRQSLSEQTIVALRTVKDSIRRLGGIINVPVTGKLLRCVRESHRNYTESRENMEGSIKRAREEQKNPAVSKKPKGNSEEGKREIEKQIQTLREEANTSQEVIAEGNRNLQDAMKKKDFMQMKIASALIAAGTDKINVISDKIKKLESIKA